MDYDFPNPPTRGVAARSAFTHNASKSVIALHASDRGQSPVIPGDLPKSKAAAKNLTPSVLCGILSGSSSTQLDIETVKKLRLLLRNESARLGFIFDRLTNR